MKTMGLDNSIEVKRTPYSEKIKELAAYELSYDTDHKYDFEVAYWRKCWNVRSAILEVLGDPTDNGTTPVAPDELTRIIDALKRFNAKTWDENGGSIWTWTEYKKHMRRNVKDLIRLRKLMDKYPELEVVFVDSY